MDPPLKPYWIYQCDHRGYSCGCIVQVNVKYRFLLKDLRIFYVPFSSTDPSTSQPFSKHQLRKSFWVAFMLVPGLLPIASAITSDPRWKYVSSKIQQLNFILHCSVWNTSQTRRRDEISSVADVLTSNTLRTKNVSCLLGRLKHTFRLSESNILVVNDDCNWKHWRMGNKLSIEIEWFTEFSLDERKEWLTKFLSKWMDWVTYWVFVGMECPLYCPLCRSGDRHLTTNSMPCSSARGNRLCKI